MNPPSNERSANLRPRSPRPRAPSPSAGIPVSSAFSSAQCSPTSSDAFHGPVFPPTSIPPPPGLHKDPPEHLIRRSEWAISPELLARASHTDAPAFSGRTNSENSHPFRSPNMTPTSSINFELFEIGSQFPEPLPEPPQSPPATNSAVNPTNPVQQPSYPPDAMHSTSAVIYTASTPTPLLIRHMNGAEVLLGEWIVLVTSDNVHMLIEMELPLIIGDENTLEVQFKVLMYPCQREKTDVVLSIVKTPGRRRVAAIRSLFKHRATQPKCWSLAIFLSSDLDNLQLPGVPRWAFGWDLEPIWHDFTDEISCYATLLFFYAVTRPADFPGVSFTNDQDLQPLRVHRTIGSEILEDSVVYEETGRIMYRLGCVGYRREEQTSNLRRRSYDD